jgi:DNA-directed RNA polymerase specialized sigma subunit
MSKKTISGQIPTKKRRSRRKSGSNSRQYFTQVHEDAILKYVATNDARERTELYRLYIGPAFNEMVDKIVFTYKFTTLPNIDSLRDECKIWLITVLDKYDVNKGSKAFSYFSVITKNWFIHKVKRKSKQKRQEMNISGLPKELELRHISTSNPYYKDRMSREFWHFLEQEINSWEHDKMKENEKKVLEAVKILMESCDDIEIFNKKAIYLYLREITGLNTKQVVNNLNKMRIRYRSFRIRWNSGDI